MSSRISLRPPNPFIPPNNPSPTPSSSLSFSNPTPPPPTSKTFETIQTIYFYYIMIWYSRRVIAERFVDLYPTFSLVPCSPTGVFWHIDESLFGEMRVEGNNNYANTLWRLWERRCYSLLRCRWGCSVPSLRREGTSIWSLVFVLILFGMMRKPLWCKWTYAWCAYMASVFFFWWFLW